MTMEDLNHPLSLGMLSVLEALKKASHDLHSNPSPPSPAVPIRWTPAPPPSRPSSSGGPSPTVSSPWTPTSSPSLALSRHLSNLKSLVSTLQNSRSHVLGLDSFLTPRVFTHSISRVPESIEYEIQTWMDQEIVEKLVAGLRKKGCEDEDELVELLSQLDARVLRGFERDYKFRAIVGHQEPQVKNHMQELLADGTYVPKGVCEEGESPILLPWSLFLPQLDRAQRSFCTVLIFTSS